MNEKSSNQMAPDARIFVAGHRGMVGSACVRALRAQGYENLILRTRREVDLQDAAAVRRLYEETRPEYVIVAAARVGGILANQSQPVEFLRQNLQIQDNLIGGAYDAGVEKLLFLGSSCIYPKMAPQPIPESALLTGPLEPTNDAYAIAKIAGIKLCQAYSQEYGKRFISAMPTNLYGPEDNFDLQSSHVLPAMIRKFHDAKERGEGTVTLWGTGSPRREFLHSDDLADACVYLLNRYDDPEIVNVGCGEDIAIRELAELIRGIVGFEGELVWDSSKPDGTPRKLMDVTKLTGLGWKARTPLDEGIRSVYQWWLDARCKGLA